MLMDHDDNHKVIKVRRMIKIHKTFGNKFFCSEAQEMRTFFIK